MRECTIGADLFLHWDFGRSQRVQESLSRRAAIQFVATLFLHSVAHVFQQDHCVGISLAERT